MAVPSPDRQGRRNHNRIGVSADGAGNERFSLLVLECPPILEPPFEFMTVPTFQIVNNHDVLPVIGLRSFYHGGREKTTRLSVSSRTNRHCTGSRRRRPNNGSSPWVKDCGFSTGWTRPRVRQTPEGAAAHATFECGNEAVSSGARKKWWTFPPELGIEDRCRDVAQLGRALRSGRRSRAFKSRHPDHFFPYLPTRFPHGRSRMPGILSYHPAAAAIWKMGRYMAMIIPPTTPPRKTIMKGSSSAVIASTAASTSSS
jgi:hypothetical protein